ncbi:hypothetical protein KIL84_003981 [Mauremys mutica]|uniref:Uncharacterized protein n=1 Tax=Mauremys mutica TaxID=74926 RepID=A0A9D3WXF2_9SAUR|nr:hypothetical protein KIL84_003981 [Mauremys mutica]
MQIPLQPPKTGVIMSPNQTFPRQQLYNCREATVHSTQRPIRLQRDRFAVARNATHPFLDPSDHRQAETTTPSMQCSGEGDHHSQQPLLRGTQATWFESRTLTAEECAARTPL